MALFYPAPCRNDPLYEKKAELLTRQALLPTRIFKGPSINCLVVYSLVCGRAKRTGRQLDNPHHQEGLHGK